MPLRLVLVALIRVIEEGLVERLACVQVRANNVTSQLWQLRLDGCNYLGYVAHTTCLSFTFLILGSFCMPPT
jgi:hypothetical protein